MILINHMQFPLTFIDKFLIADFIINLKLQFISFDRLENQILLLALKDLGWVFHLNQK